jgi:hypothetical protein
VRRRSRRCNIWADQALGQVELGQGFLGGVMAHRARGWRCYGVVARRGGSNSPANHATETDHMPAPAVPPASQAPAEEATGGTVAMNGRSLAAFSPTFLLRNSTEYGCLSPSRFFVRSKIA